MALFDLPTGTVFTRRWALMHGCDGRTLTNWVQAGMVTRFGNGVYRVGHTDLPDPRAISRATNTVVSFESAAAWLGGSLPTAAAHLNLTAPRNRGRRADAIPGVWLHRCDLPRSDIVTVRGVQVTTPARTLRDLAQTLTTEEAVAVGDSLCRAGQLSPDEALGYAIQLPRGAGRPAAVRVASLLDPRAESVFESISRVRVIEAGLPAPTAQLNVFSREGTWIAQVDFAWEKQRVILECDGFEFHSDRATFRRDRRRWSALTRAGWRVLVVTWDDVVGDPAYLPDLLADMLHV